MNLDLYKTVTFRCYADGHDNHAWLPADVFTSRLLYCHRQRRKTTEFLEKYAYCRNNEVVYTVLPHQIGFFVVFTHSISHTHTS